MWIAEGPTEAAAREALKRFLDDRCFQGGRPRVGLKPIQFGSKMLREDKLRRPVQWNLEDVQALGVVALIDVRSELRGRQFADAAEAIAYLSQAAPGDPRYRAHAAQFDFEAWLLPYWQDICRRLQIKPKAPAGQPEQVNHQKPPSKRLDEIYRIAGRKYNKPIEAPRILQGKDLTVSAAQCPQFKAFLNSLLDLGGCPRLP